MYTHIMNDEKLFFLCKKYGEIAVRYRNKFAGLLPEVYRRGLYKRKGYFSIFEFAAKLAGMSEEQVRRVLNLDKKFENMPALRGILTNGEVSVSKLAKIASIATPENDNALARQVRLLPRSALETFVRDEKQSESVPGNTNPSSFLESATDETKQDLNLTSKVKQKLFELQQKGIDINALLLEFLEKRELEIAQEKEALAAEFKVDQKSPRYIPVRVRKILVKEYGAKCSVKHCKKMSVEIHHTQRFSLSQNHDPHFLAPLCKEHHVIAHSIDMKFHNKRLIRSPP